LIAMNSSFQCRTSSLTHRIRSSSVDCRAIWLLNRSRNCYLLSVNWKPSIWLSINLPGSPRDMRSASIWILH
jgi:hypothetical protein